MRLSSFQIPLFLKRFPVPLSQMPLRRTEEYQVLTRHQDIKCASLVTLPGVNEPPCLLSGVLFVKSPSSQNAPDSGGGGCVCSTYTRGNLESPQSETALSRSFNRLSKLLEPEKTEEGARPTFVVLQGLESEALGCGVIVSGVMAESGVGRIEVP